LRGGRLGDDGASGQKGSQPCHDRHASQPP
jgi:hypothetical protein